MQGLLLASNEESTSLLLPIAISLRSPLAATQIVPYITPLNF